MDGFEAVKRELCARSIAVTLHRLDAADEVGCVIG